MRWTLFAAVAAVSLFTAPLLAAGVPELDGFRMDNYNAPVPETLAGAQVVDAQALAAAQASGTIVIDVMPSARRPATLPEDRPWMPPPRMDVPGSLWWPEVGRGAISPALDAWFRAKLAEVTGGKLGSPVAFYCKAECWMSWNAAKRAIGYGYRKVLWFPGGAEAWAAAGFTLHAGTPEAVPAN
jgi:PQQ-dependent catabolism-associated CXXCW motif protein